MMAAFFEPLIILVEYLDLVVGWWEGYKYTRVHAQKHTCSGKGIEMKSSQGPPKENSWINCGVSVSQGIIPLLQRMDWSQTNSPGRLSIR